MSKAFYIVAYKNGVAICGKWVRADNREKALYNMGWDMAIDLPNIDFNDLQITQERE